MKPLDGVVAGERADSDAPAAQNGSGRPHSREGQSLTRQDRANLLRFMVMMRAAEERGITLYRQGKVPGSF